MIYTLTICPALDYTLHLGHMQTGVVNRTRSEELRAGGKGVNVSVVLKNLGLESVALGFLAGFTGEEIERRLKSVGCGTDFIYLETGMSRINVKLIGETTTDINAQGPKIPRAAMNQLQEKLDRLTGEDCLILAGNVTPVLPDYTYAELMANIANRGIRVIVDAEGELLQKTLPQHPYLIKPNREELGELFSTRFYREDEVIRAAKELRAMGAQNVLVSLGEDGAVLAAENGEVYTCRAPRGEVQNPVGAGDSMVAGFLYGRSKTDRFEDILRYSIAAGSASAFSNNLANQKDVEVLKNLLS